MPRTRGRSPEEQTLMEKENTEAASPKTDWAEGALATAQGVPPETGDQPQPGDQIKAAAEAIAQGGENVTTGSQGDILSPPAQPYLPGQEPPLREQVLFAMRDWEKELALIDSREEKQQEKNESERRIIRREAELLRRLLATLPEPVQA
jgi:hypothetical protein